MSLYKHGLAIFVLAFSMIKSCIKSGLILLSLVFSLNAVAEITVFSCEGNDIQSYNDYKPVYESDPNDLENIYILSTKALCIGKMSEGMALLERASDGGHVQASFFMGLYYEKDQTWDTEKEITEDPESFNAMLFYYERAADQIEAVSNYPDNTHDSMPYFEERNFVSAKVFSFIPNMYYTGYYDALIQILGSSEKVSYTDTLEVLEKMAYSAERCLDRPSLSVWKSNRSRVANTMQVRCQALLDFAEQVYPLEQERIYVAERCTNPVNDCAEHTDVLHKMGNLMNIMLEKYSSVSF